MSTRILILKDGVITPSRSATDTNSIVTSLGLTKSSVGLNLVDNTSDNNKPISVATQTALNLKANLASPALTGTPTAPTASSGTNTTQLATTAFVSTAISNLVASSPAALDTLNELATALGNDANFSTTITNSLALKANLASPALTGIPTTPTAPAGTNTTQIASTAFVSTAISNFVDLTTNQNIAGIKTFTNTTASTSTTTGALIVSGGIATNQAVFAPIVQSTGGVIITGTHPTELDTSYGFIRHSSGPLLFFIGNTTPFYFKKGNGGAGDLVSINQDGTISYRQTIPTGTGTTCVFSGGKIIALSSSKEVKENIRKLEIKEDILDLINPVTFNYIGQDPVKQVAHGFIVEEIEAVDPSLVTYEKGKAYSIQHSELVAVLWSEVKKLKKLYANNY